MAHIPVNQTGQPSFKAQARLRTEGELSSAQNWGGGGQMGSTACHTQVDWDQLAQNGFLCSLFLIMFSERTNF